MKRLALFAAIGALLSPTLSLAQPGGHPDRGPGDNRPGDHRPGGGHGGPDRPGNPGGNRPGDHRPGGGHDGPDRPGRPGDHRPDFRPGRPGPGPGMMRPDRPNFSWRGRSFSPIRGNLFRYPHGYSYRRWTIGTLLPGLFLSSSYYYDDWRTLGIDRPPPGRRWVRYGPDLLLVNLRTRRVEDVITDVFY